VPPAIIPAAVAITGALLKKVFPKSGLVDTLVTVANTGVIGLLLKPKSNKLNQGAELKTKIQTDMPRQVLTGLTASGGSCHFAFTRTDTSKKPNRYLYRVIQVSDQPVNNLLKVMESKDQLTFSGDVTTGWRACNQHKAKNGNTCMWLRFYKGSFTPTADATLVSETGGIWSSAHKGTGLCYAIVKYDSDPDAFPNGEPELTFVVEGAKLYDDRKDSTKPGGSGAHRLATYSTWEYSETTSVIIAQYLRGFKINGKLIVGVQAEERDLSTAMLFSAHNTCEQDVVTATGTEKRYVSGYILTSSEPASEHLLDLQASMDGKIFDRGGSITILPGANRTPTMNLADQDIDWTAQKSWQPKPALEQMLNHITANFIDAGMNFQERDLPVLANAQWEIDDGNERFSSFFSFKALNRWSQGQRITKRMHLASRFGGTTAFIGPIWLLELEQGDWFTLTSTRWEFATKYFEVEDITITKDLRLAIIAREVSPTIDGWDYAVDEKPRADTTWTPPAYDIPIPTIVASNYVNLDAGTGVQSNGLTATLSDAPGTVASFVKSVEVQYALTSNLGLPLPGGQFSIEQGKINIPGVQPGTNYSVRGRFSDGSRFGDWSAWAATAVPAASQVPIGGVSGLGALADDNYAVYGAGGTIKETVGGVDATLANFKTNQGTAAFLNNQGTGATANSLAQLNATEGTKLTGIAAGATVGARAGTNIYRTDGTTIMTQLELRTSEGTAAFIANQGLLAVMNAATWATHVTGTGKPSDNAGTTLNLYQIGTGTMSIQGNQATLLTNSDFTATILTRESFPNSAFVCGRNSGGYYIILGLTTNTTALTPGVQPGVKNTYNIRTNNGIGSATIQVNGVTVYDTYPAISPTLATFLWVIYTGQRIIFMLDNVVLYSAAAPAGLTLTPRVDYWYNGAAVSDLKAGPWGDTNTYRTDGVTILTQAEIRTAEGTAAFLNSQGAGATANSLAQLNASEGTKFAGIATGATVGARSGTNLYRTDGTTILSQAEVRTAEGTSAFVNNQSWFTTAAALDLEDTTHLTNRTRISRLDQTTGRAAANFQDVNGIKFSSLPRVGTARNGDAVSFGGSLPAVPEIIPLYGGNGPTTGRNVVVQAQNATVSGFTMRAVEQAVTAGTTYTDGPGVAGGGGEPTLVINRSNGSVPFDGIFTFTVSVTVGLVSPGGGGEPPDPGIIGIGLYCKQGGAWIQVGSFYTSVSGTQVIGVPTTADFGAGNEFGISVITAEGSGTAVNGFTSVKYTSGTVTETNLTPTGTSSPIRFMAFLP
jgi:hypothetical protein